MVYELGSSGLREEVNIFSREGFLPLEALFCNLNLAVCLRPLKLT
jgi:hypothetical protein